MRPRFLPLVLLTLLLAQAPVSAAAPDPTSGSRWVEATLDLASPDVRRIELAGTLLIHKHDILGRVYTATEMSESYQAGTNFGAGTGEAFVANMEERIRTSFSATLASVFPDATRSVDAVVVDRASLSAPRVDAFDPPIRVTVAARVERSNAQLGLGSYSDAAIEAALKAGAAIETTLRFTADPGYLSTYVLRAPSSPAGLVFSQAEGATPADGGARVVVRLDNLAGVSVLPRDVSVSLTKAGALAPGAEDIATRADVRLGELREGASALDVTIDVQADVRAVDVATRFPGALPPNVELAFLSADGLRGMRQAGALSDADLARADEALLATLRRDLGAALGVSTNVTGALVRTDLATPPGDPYRTEPPVRFTAHATGSRSIDASQAEDLDLALDLGAIVRLDVPLFSGKRATTFVIHAPPGLAVAEAEGGTIAGDGASATFVVAANALAPSGTIGLHRAGSPVLTAEQAEVGIVVDLKELDVSLGQATKGDFGSLLAEVTVVGELAALRMPDDVKGALPAALDLDFLSSEGVRLLRERGLVTDEQLTDIEAKLLATIEEKLGAALGADVEVRGGFDQPTLAPGGDAARPIVFRAQASFTKALSGGEVPRTAALALITLPQSFTLPRVQGLDTTYTVILPRGLAVTHLEADGGEASRGEAADGRDQFTVTPSGGEARATVSIAVTPTFVLVKFWPLVLVASLVLVLLVGSPVAVVVLRRRRRRDAP